MSFTGDYLFDCLYSWITSDCTYSFPMGMTPEEEVVYHNETIENIVYTSVESFFQEAFSGWYQDDKNAISKIYTEILETMADDDNFLYPAENYLDENGNVDFDSMEL